MVNSLYRKTVLQLEATFRSLEIQVTSPVKVPYLNGHVFRYEQKSPQQAIVQKLARVVSGLYAIDVLLQAGLLQEQGAVKRISDEIQEDIIFLSFGIIDETMTDLHEEYLRNFYEEEFDKPESPRASTQARATIPRKKIRAYIARREEYGLDPSTGAALGKTLSPHFSPEVGASGS